MLINDLIALLMQVPPVLAGSWGVWFFTGLVLSIWQRKEKARLVVHGPALKHKSGVRPPSGNRVAAPKPAHTVPPSSSDAFGELEQLLDEKTSSPHRRPGDLETPLAAPQSLP